MRDYYAIIERDENGEFFGYVPQLRGCHTQGENVADLMRNLEEALNLYLEANPEKIASMSEFIRQSGSHLVMKNETERTAVVPVHAGKILGVGLVKKILSDAEIPEEEVRV